MPSRVVAKSTRTGATIVDALSSDDDNLRKLLHTDDQDPAGKTHYFWGPDGKVYTARLAGDDTLTDLTDLQITGFSGADTPIQVLYSPASGLLHFVLSSADSGGSYKLYIATPAQGAEATLLATILVPDGGSEAFAGIVLCTYAENGTDTYFFCGSSKEGQHGHLYRYVASPPGWTEIGVGTIPTTAFGGMVPAFGYAKANGLAYLAVSGPVGADLSADARILKVTGSTVTLHLITNTLTLDSYVPITNPVIGRNGRLYVCANFAGGGDPVTDGAKALSAPLSNLNSWTLELDYGASLDFSLGGASFSFNAPMYYPALMLSARRLWLFGHDNGSGSGTFVALVVTGPGPDFTVVEQITSFALPAHGDTDAFPTALFRI